MEIRCVKGRKRQSGRFAVMRGGEPVELPDFTRGAWRTAKPQDIGTVDFRKMGLVPDTLTKDKAEMSV